MLKKEMMQQIRIDLGVEEPAEEMELLPADNDNAPEGAESGIGLR